MQPADGHQYKRINATAAGTTDVLTRKGNLIRIVIPANKTGTLSLYDQNAGTSAATLINDVPLTVGTIPTAVEFGIRVQKGLRIVSGGTVDCVVVYD